MVCFPVFGRDNQQRAAQRLFGRQIAYQQFAVPRGLFLGHIICQIPAPCFQPKNLNNQATRQTKLKNFVSSLLDRSRSFADFSFDNSGLR
jgi:hypothetical protein